jgi:hypothetical protein
MAANKKIRLFRLSEGKGTTDIYIFSLHPKGSDCIPSLLHQDHGGTDYSDWARVLEIGVLYPIKSLEEVPAADHRYVPYRTPEADDWIVEIEEIENRSYTIADHFGKQLL